MRRKEIRTRAREPARRPARRRGPASAEPGGDRQLILVVEDDANEWEMYGKLLWYNGFDVLYARSAEEGLDLARSHRPDLVLIDLVLPGMDGLELCRSLTADPRTAELRRVALTGRPEADWGARAREAGFDGYLEKPRTPVEVLHDVEGMIGKPPPGAAGSPPELSTRDFHRARRVSRGEGGPVR